MIRSVYKESGFFVSFKRVCLWRNKHLKQTMSCSSSGTSPTAGVIVIGDEILKGQVRDTNSHFIISRLYNIGVRVMKVSVIGDNVDEISNEVRKFSRFYTYVITSGGIGPTHDDVTFEGVARAFDETVAPHPEIVKICSQFYKTTDLSSPAMKLACIPKSARLKYGFDTVQNRRAMYPNISVQNVYIFPGVPPLLEKSFAMLCEDLFGGSGVKFHLCELFVDENEVAISEHLTAAVEEFPSVVFGSYPQQDHSYYRVKLTVEANDQELLLKAVNRLKELLPPNCLVDFDSMPLESSYEKIEALSLQNGMSYVGKALQELFQALSNLRLEDTVLCIDASLISVATVHLFHAVLQKQNKTGRVSTVLINNQESPQSKRFLEDCVSRYSLHLIKTDPCDMKTTMSALSCSHNNLKILTIGFRCDHSALQRIVDFSYGDKNVSLLYPVFPWDDAQIMQFIRKLNLHFMKNN